MRFLQKVRQTFGFAREDLPARPTDQEIATRRAGQFAQLVAWLPNPDKILKKTGKHVKHLRELRYDDEVFSAVQYLTSALREFEWELAGGHEEQERPREQARRWLRRLNFDRIDGEIISARLYGYQPFEIDWQERGGRWQPLDVVGKPPEWFAFDPDGRLALRAKLGAGNDLRPGNLRELPPGKFLLARNKPSYANPYGEAALSRCFWPVTFKKGGLRFWVTFAEKYGMPFAVGKHPRGEQDDKIEDLLDMLEAMVTDAVAAIPDDSSVELLDADRADSNTVYKELIAYCERSINKVLLSNELTTTNPESGGTYAATQAQIENVSGAVVADCRRLKEQVISDLLRLVWHYNFPGGAAAAPRLRCYQREEVGKERAQRDEILTRTGVAFTEDYFTREYNFEDGDFDLQPAAAGAAAAPGPSPTAPEAFARRPRHGTRFAEEEAAEPGQQLIDDLTAGATTPEEDQADMERLLAGNPLAPIRLIREGESEDEIMQALARAYPAMDAEALEERLASLLFIAETYGRLEADHEADGGNARIES